MSQRRVPVSERRSRSRVAVRPARSPQSDYAPWEFWAHFGVLVLVPVALNSIPHESSGEAQTLDQPVARATPRIGDGSPGAQTPACLDDRRCLEATR